MAGAGRRELELDARDQNRSGNRNFNTRPRRLNFEPMFARSSGIEEGPWGQRGRGGGGGRGAGGEGGGEELVGAAQVDGGGDGGGGICAFGEVDGGRCDGVR